MNCILTTLFFFLLRESWTERGCSCGKHAAAEQESSWLWWDFTFSWSRFHRLFMCLVVLRREPVSIPSWCHTLWRHTYVLELIKKAYKFTWTYAHATHALVQAHSLCDYLFLSVTLSPSVSPSLPLSLPPYLFLATLPPFSSPPWYDLHGWLGVKQQLYIYLSTSLLSLSPSLSL